MANNTKKAKSPRHKARLDMAQIREAFRDIKTESLHRLVGWLCRAAEGDDTSSVIERLCDMIKATLRRLKK